MSIFDTIPSVQLTQTTFLNKLQRQKEDLPLILCADIDGTIFTAGWRIIKAPFYNFQTIQIMNQFSIPLILVTGRQTWNKVFQQEMPSHGINNPDVIIAGAGTEIFYRKKNNDLEKDLAWRKSLLETIVTWSIPNQQPYTEKWDKEHITNFLKSFRLSHKLRLIITKGNALLVRLFIEHMPIAELDDCIDQLLSIWPKGISIQVSEKLLRENTNDFFTGDMLIMPIGAGKDNALAYVLKNFSLLTHKKLHAFIFGDATIDIPMLTMKETTYYNLSQYGVHLTALAKKTLEKVKHKRLEVTSEEGPQTILNVTKQELQGKKSSSHQANNEKIKQSHFSKAQNNSARQLLKIFEPLLNNIVDPTLSPNQISFLGLEKIKQSVVLIQNKKFLKQLQGLYLYCFGNFTDVLDGVRARSQLFPKQKIPGQLVDGFCDRAKEFYQLYRRATVILSAAKNLPQKEDPSVSPQDDIMIQTILSALSCVLPSIARAQCETQNIIVKEKDEKGGSMINRTRLLFLSFLLQTINMNARSFQIDKQIYEKNLATFKNRLNNLSDVPPLSFSRRRESIQIKIPYKGQDLTPFQKNALERFLLYVQVLQEEHSIITDFFKQHILLQQPNTEIVKQFESIIQPYLKLNIPKLRKQYGFKTYSLLSLKNARQLIHE